VAFSPDGELLAAASSDGVVRLANPRVHTQFGTPMPARGAIALSPDGGTLAAAAPGRDDPAVRLWDAATQRPGPPPLGGGKAHRPVAAISFTPDGRRILLSGQDGLRLWDVAVRREVARDTALRGTAELSPDGRFAAVGHGGAIAIWGLKDRRETGPRIHVPGHTDLVTAMAFDPRGARLAVAGADDRVRLFEVATRRQIHALPMATQQGLLNDLAFSPDGRTLAVTAADSTVRFWDLVRHRPAGTALTPRSGAITALAFSPDGQVLATGATDSDVQLWDLRTHRRLGGAMTGHSGGVLQVAYGRDGTLLATAGGDGTARLWRAGPPRDPVAAACANAGRPLGRDEWRIHVPDATYRRTCP
jgi:WD40 repeat protein